MTYKDKEKQRASERERSRRYRQKGVTQGVTEETKGVTENWEIIPAGKGVTIPDIIDKLTDKFWRPRLEKICQSFQASHNPSYSQMCRIGETNLSVACDWLECTG